MAERDAALREIVGREFQGHFVAGQNADVVLAHLAVGVRDEFMTVVKLDTVAGVGQDFQNLAGHFNKVFFCHRLCFGGCGFKHRSASSSGFMPPSSNPLRRRFEWFPLGKTLPRAN